MVFSALLPLSFAVAGPLEERIECWEGYSVCVLGAGTAEKWRTVCYSDYSACMKSPGAVQCHTENQANCDVLHRTCIDQGAGNEVITNHCEQDRQVCLDAFGC